MSMTTFKTQIYLTYENEDLVNQLFGLRRLFFNYAIDRIYSTDGAKNTMGLLSEVYADIASQKARPAILNANMRYGNSQHFLKEVFEDAIEAAKLAEKNSKKQKKDIRVEYQRKKDRKETFSMYGKGPHTISQEGPHTISAIFNKDIGRVFMRTRESVDFISKRTDKIRTMTITRKGGKYWLSLTFERTNRVLEKPAAGTVVGIDLGVKISSVQFDGKETRITNFNTKGSLRSERLANKVDLSRKKQGSKRYEKAVLMKQRRAMRSQNQRLAEVEKHVTELCKTYETIAVDDFSFNGALKIANNASVYRSMKGTFLTRLQQKAEEYGTKVLKIPHQKGVKTTHKCSTCGSENIHVDRKNRIVTCADCGLSIDRDQNGAINTYRYGIANS